MICCSSTLYKEQTGLYKESACGVGGGGGDVGGVGGGGGNENANYMAINTFKFHFL